MTVFENRERYDASNVWFEGGRIRVYDKKNRRPEMRHIDYGLGVFSAAAFAGCPRGTPLDLADLQTSLCARGELAGHEITRRFYEIGSPAGWRELDEYLQTVPPSRAGPGNDA